MVKELIYGKIVNCCAVGGSLCSKLCSTARGCYYDNEKKYIFMIIGLQTTDYITGIYCLWEHIPKY